MNHENTKQKIEFEEFRFKKKEEKTEHIKMEEENR